MSPLSETISGLQQLGDRGRQATNLRWVRWAADELAAGPLDLSRTWPLVVHRRPAAVPDHGPGLALLAG